MNLYRTFLIFASFWLNEMVILSKVPQPHTFESRSFLKLNFTNIWSLRSNLIGSESYLKPTSSDILALYETNIEKSIYSSNFSVWGFLHLIWKNSVSHVHRIAVYVKRGISFERGTYLKKTMKILSYERCSMGKYI